MIASFTAWLETLPFAIAIAQADWLFPMIECIHVLALTLVFGSDAIIDLRLINVSLKARSVADLAQEVLPWTWGAFLVAAITGSLLFSSAATRYSGLFPFKMKMVLLLLVGLNMAIFHLGPTGLSRAGAARVRRPGRLTRPAWCLWCCGRQSLSVAAGSDFCDAMARQKILLSKEEAKNFDAVGWWCGNVSLPQPLAKVFWFFSSEKNAFLLRPRAKHGGCTDEFHP